MGEALKVLVAEDSVILRDGLIGLLNRRGCVAEGVGDSAELLAHLGTLNSSAIAGDSSLPDVLVIDIRMPPTFTDEGLRAAKTIRQTYPSLPLLLFSQYVEARYATELLSGDTRGIGYLLKDRVADVGEFVASLHRVANGETVLDPEVVSQLVRTTMADTKLARLAPREKEVLELMAEGRSNAAICELLHLSAGAVEKNVAAIFTKLDLPVTAADNRRVLAVRHYLGIG